MALGTPTYPTTLDTDATLGPTTGIVAGTTVLGAVGTNQGDQLGITKNLINNSVQLETVVGVTNSVVTTSHEYRIRRFFWRVFTALDYIPSATNNAVFATRNATPIMVFSHGGTQTAIFLGVIPAGAVLTGGAVIRIKWAAATGTTGNVRWSAAFERMSATIGADAFQAAVAATTTTNASAGVLVETAITLTALNSAVALDPYRFEVQRLGGDAADTMLVDAQVVSVTIESAT